MALTQSILPTVWAAGIGAGGLGLLLKHMLLDEPNSVEITRYDVMEANLPDELDGLVICQVSDPHITAAPRNRAAVAKAIRSVQADLFVVTGDLIYQQGGTQPFFDWLDALGDAIRPVVVVFGNAEHKRTVRTEEIERGLADRGAPVLNNRSITMNLRGGTVQVVGVDDSHSHHSNFTAAYREAKGGLWTLLLCHTPDGLAEIWGERADLALCGHTHGGQIRLPLIGPIFHNTGRIHGIVSGWYEGNSLTRRAYGAFRVKRVYVSRGLGTTRFPGRLLCRPELPVFTLRRSE